MNQNQVKLTDEGMKQIQHLIHLSELITELLDEAYGDKQNIKNTVAQGFNVNLNPIREFIITKTKINEESSNEETSNKEVESKKVSNKKVSNKKVEEKQKDA